MSIGWSHDSQEPGSTHQVDQLVRRPAVGHDEDSPQPGAHRVAVLVERRRRGVVAMGDLGAVGLEEPQRWAGQRDRAEHRVVDVDEQALARGLLPARRPRRWCAPCRPGSRPRPAGPAAPRRPSRRRPARPARSSARGWRRARGCWPGPSVVASTSKPSQNRRHRPSLPTAIWTLRRGSGTARRARSRGGGCPGPRRPRRRRSTGCPGTRAPRRSRPAARCARRSPRRSGRARAARRARRTRRTSRPAGPRSARRPAAGRRARSRSATSARPRPGRSGRSRRGRPRSVVAEAGDREHHQPRVALVQRLEPEPEPLEHPGAEVLDEHVRPVDQLQQHLACRRRP